MSLPKIVQTGKTVLRVPASPVTPEQIGSPELKRLVATMIKVMRAAPGVGLAAPQLGVPLQILVMEDKDSLMTKLSPDQRALRGRVPFPLTVLFNPELSPVGDSEYTFFEGCLSVSGFSALVPRKGAVQVRGLDESGTPVCIDAEGWPARIFQHEIDHLKGVLYIDRMLSRSFCVNEEAAHWLLKPVDEVKRAFGIFDTKG